MGDIGATASFSQIIGNTYTLGTSVVCYLKKFIEAPEISHELRKEVELTLPSLKRVQNLSENLSEESVTPSLRENMRSLAEIFDGVWRSIEKRTAPNRRDSITGCLLQMNKHRS